MDEVNKGMTNALMFVPLLFIGALAQYYNQHKGDKKMNEVEIKPQPWDDVYNTNKGDNK